MIALRAKKQEDFNQHVVEEQKLMHRYMDEDVKVLSNLSSALNNTAKKLFQHDGNILALLNQNALKANYYNLYTEVESSVDQMERIFFRASSGMLDPIAMKKPHLKAVLEKIEASSLDSSPLFSSNSAYKYYNTKGLTKVWLEKKEDNKTVQYLLHHVLQVPVVDFREKIRIKPISKEAKEESRFDLYAFDAIGRSAVHRYHTFLVNEELQKACIFVKPNYVCRSRRARIFESWDGKAQLGDTVVHAITTSSYVVKSSVTLDGSLLCGEEESTVKVCASCMIEVPSGCSLSTRLFSIPSAKKTVVREDVQEFAMWEEHEAVELLEKKLHPEYPLPSKTVETMKTLIEASKNKTAEEEDDEEWIKRLNVWEQYLMRSAPYTLPIFGILLLVVGICLCICCKANGWKMCC